MSGYSLFQTSTLGMMAQAHALNTIGSNIANISTGGYKRIDTRFVTMLSSNIRTGAGANSQISFANEERGLGGVKPKDFQTLDQQGLLKATERSLDLAIAGDGFFQVSPTLALSNEIFFTRDGGFDVNVAGAPVTATADDGSTINVSQGFLADKNGFFLLGVAPETDGTFSPTGALIPLRVDQFAFTNNFSATTTINLNVNLPAQAVFPSADENLSLTVVDSNGKTRAVTATFIKTPTANQWHMEFTADDLANVTQAPGNTFSVNSGTTSGNLMVLDPATRTISIKNESVPSASSPGVFIGLRPGDPITLTGTALNDGIAFTIGSISADFATITVATGTPLVGGPENVTALGGATSTRVVGDRLIFDSSGQLSSPATVTPTLTWSDGATTTFAMDISAMSQLKGDFTPINFSQNGLSSSDMTSVTFDSKGHVIGQFADGSSRKIYKIPLAVFTNVNGLEPGNGNTYEESVSSGTRRSVFADTSGIAILAPNTLELSNVDLATQFTQMIQVQQAYNSSATVFKTVDEMTMVARDLKA